MSSLFFSISSFAYVNFAKQIKETYFPSYPIIEYGTGPQADLIKRGEYLARVGDCISCHTAEERDAKPFAGSRAMLVPPFGTFYTPNITGDKKTGIGDWTEANFVEAMHNGQGIHGQNLYPVFPYIFFNRVTDTDLKAIYAYLQSLPKVNKEKPKDKILFPFSIRFMQYGWRMLFFYPHRGVYKPDPDKTPAWNRGAYLVDGLGHCSMCHTPHNLLGAQIQSQYMAGSYVENFWAPNITSAALDTYSVSDIVKVFKKGILLGGQGQVLGPMSEANHNSLRYLENQDLEAIAIYLKSVKPIEPKAAKTAQINNRAVINIYKTTCAACHDYGIEGAPILGNEASWNLRLKSGISALVKNAILGYNQMPAKGTCMVCSNAQIRAVVEWMVTRSQPSLTKAPMIVVPTSPQTTPLSMQEGENVYQESCASCHDRGKFDAPKIGDKNEWQKRIHEKGTANLLRFAIFGKDGKHIRGDCTHCTNAEVVAAAKYLLQKSTSNMNFNLW